MASETSGFSSFVGEGNTANTFANTSRMSADDSLYSTVTIPAGESSESMTCTDGQSFTMPDDASPTGFLISIKWHTNGEPADLTITFKGVTSALPLLMTDGLSNGGPGTNYGTFGSSSSTTDVTMTGGEFQATAPVTGAQVKEDDFGIQFYVKNTGSNPAIVSVNYPFLTVNYTHQRADASARTVASGLVASSGRTVSAGRAIY